MSLFMVARAKLGCNRKHDFNQSLASHEVALGQSPPTLGKPLGNTQVQTAAANTPLRD